MAPGELGDVDQPVDALEVDEGAEVDDVRDLALDDLPRLQAPEDLLADLLALLLEHRATREHDVVARAVELDHLALERLAHELVEVVDAADVDQRRGQEAAHAEVEDQAALDDLDHGAVDRLAGLGGGLDLAPRLLEAGALLGEDQAALLVLLGEDEGVDLLAQRDLVGGVHRAADRELVRGDDALGLVADVDEDLVLVDPDDRAGDDVALIEGLDGRVVVGDELAVDLDQQLAGAAVRPRRRRRGSGRLGRVRGSVGACLDRRTRRQRWQTAVETPGEGCRYPRRDARARHETGLGAHAARGRVRRADLRRELRRAGRGARAGRHRGPGADRSTATRSGSARPRPAPPRRGGWRRWASTHRSARRSATLVIHTPHATVRFRLPWTLLDLRLPRALRAALRPVRRRVRDRDGEAAADGARPCTRTAATSSAPLVVDALGWRRVLSGAGLPAARRRRSRAGSRSTPPGARTSSRSGSTATTSPPATAGASRPRDEVRVGVGSFDPAHHVREPTVRLAERSRARGRSTTRATGSPTSCAPRPATGSSSPATRPATACR